MVPDRIKSQTRGSFWIFMLFSHDIFQIPFFIQCFPTFLLLPSYSSLFLTTFFLYFLTAFLYFFNLEVSLMLLTQCDVFLTVENNNGKLMFLCLSFSLPQSYIHGSSQAQFVAESHIILLLSILSPTCCRDVRRLEFMCVCFMCWHKWKPGAPKNANHPEQFHSQWNVQLLILATDFCNSSFAYSQHLGSHLLYSMSDTAFRFRCLLHLFSQHQTSIICVHSP